MSIKTKVIQKIVDVEEKALKCDFEGCHREITISKVPPGWYILKLTDGTEETTVFTKHYCFDCSRLIVSLFEMY